LVLGKEDKPISKSTVRVVDKAGKVLGKSSVDERGYFHVDIGARADHDKDPKDVPDKATAEQAVQQRVEQAKLYTSATATDATTVGTVPETPSRSQPVSLEVLEGEKVIYRDKQPLTLVRGKQLYREIRIGG
jgi:hypothetical protein